jgi:hypothetical protein
MDIVDIGMNDENDKYHDHDKTHIKTFFDTASLRAWLSLIEGT